MKTLLARIRLLRDERRAMGWRRFLRRRGWRFVLVVFLVYLARDLVLYVFVPLAVAIGLTW